MHIPDGYLSPRSAGALWVFSAPLWALSLRAIRRRVNRRRVPLVALLSAFSFLIMMLNIPLPGGTTAHAVGAVLVAILVGPWAALTAVTLALAVQALLFGDGGVLALGANAFNMAFVMPFAGYGVFRLLGGAARPGEKRFAFAAGAGGYVGINVAALFAAVELGLQPLLHHLPDGTPLYCPFPLAVTIPAMTIPHLTVAGAAEAILTAGVVAFLGRYHPELFETGSGATR
ncbi:MAG: cobalt transporter CbiM [Candidatus Krumholzibacteriaceae bacterium]